MKTTLKTLSALAIAAATLTAVTLASGSAASANPLNGAHRLPLFRHHTVFSCLACNLPRPHQTWNSNPWRFHHWGYNPWRYSNWGFRYNRWYWEHRRDRYGYRGRPGEFAFAAPAAAAPAMSAPVPGFGWFARLSDRTENAGRQRDVRGCLQADQRDRGSAVGRSSAVSQSHMKGVRAGPPVPSGRPRNLFGGPKCSNRAGKAAK